MLGISTKLHFKKFVEVLLNLIHPPNRSGKYIKYPHVPAQKRIFFLVIANRKRIGVFQIEIRLYFCFKTHILPYLGRAMTQILGEFSQKLG